MSGASAASSRPDEQQSEHRSPEPSMEEILASIRRIISDDQMLPLSPRANLPPLAPLKNHGGVSPEATAVAEHDDAEHHRVLSSEMSSTNLHPDKTFGRDEQHQSAMRAPSAPAVDLAIAGSHTDAIGLSAFDARLMELRSQHNAETQDDGDFDVAAEIAALHRKDAPTTADSATEAHAAGATKDALAADNDGGEAPHTPLNTTPSHDAILSEHTKSSVASSFHQLAANMLMQNFPPVDEIARELLRPMLKTWLDDNLPVVVERLVRIEIERVSRGVR